MSTKSKDKSKRKKAKAPEHLEKIEARHNFTDEEKLVMLSEMARYNQELESLANEAKASAAGWKTRIKTVELKVKSLTNNASNGYEMRETEARVEFDPKKGIKKYFRKDDGKFIEERTMEPHDYEMSLPLPATTGPEPKKGEGLTKVADAFNDAETSTNPFPDAVDE